MVGPLFPISSCQWILTECCAHRREDLPRTDKSKALRDPASSLAETHRRQGSGHDERKRDKRDTAVSPLKIVGMDAGVRLT